MWPGLHFHCRLFVRDEFDLRTPSTRIWPMTFYFLSPPLGKEQNTKIINYLKESIFLSTLYKVNISNIQWSTWRKEWMRKKEPCQFCSPGAWKASSVSTGMLLSNQSSVEIPEHENKKAACRCPAPEGQEETWSGGVPSSEPFSIDLSTPPPSN